MIRPLCCWYGGKSKLAKKLNASFLPHRTYVSTHAGGLSDVLNKSPAAIEVANDLDPGLINLYVVATQMTADFCEYLHGLSYSAETFRRSAAWLTDDDQLLRAVGFLVKNRMSFSSSGRTFMIDRMGVDGKGWHPFINSIHQTARRLSPFWFLNADASEVIQEYDRPDTLFYVDPPYLESERSADRHYAFEMTREQHEALLKILIRCKGMVYLSGYRSDLYDQYLGDWCRVEWPVTSAMSHSEGQGRDRTECLWARGKAGLYMMTNYS